MFHYSKSSDFQTKIMIQPSKYWQIRKDLFRYSERQMDSCFAGQNFIAFNTSSPVITQSWFFLSISNFQKFIHSFICFFFLEKKMILSTTKQQSCGSKILNWLWKQQKIGQKNMPKEIKSFIMKKNGFVNYVIFEYILVFGIYIQFVAEIWCELWFTVLFSWFLTKHLLLHWSLYPKMRSLFVYPGD